MFANATDRQLYQQAASDFRVPYWDWSRSAPAGQTHLPDFFWSPIVAQNGPNGMQNIKNPLFSYQFHPLDPEALIWNPVGVMRGAPPSVADARQLKQWNETKRGPEMSISLEAPPSNNSKANAALLSKLPEIQQRLYILFSNYHDFNAFSNKAWAVSRGLSMLDSIESIHDIIHIYGGSKGHMTYVPLSSFDPLFFMHHIMTDRIIAMWQILNPSTWISPMAAGETTFTSLKGTLQSSSTPLTPFYSSPDGTFWDSDMSRTTEAFGYTYADTDPSLGSDDAIRQSLIQKINQWYGASSPAAQLARARRPAVQSHPLRHTFDGDARDTVLAPDAKPSAAGPFPSRVLAHGHYTEWIANVHVNVGALDGSYAILFFFGLPPADEAEWELSRNLAGSVGIFTMSHMTSSQSKVSGAVPLTSALLRLVRAGAVASLSPSAVIPFLERCLHFRVLGNSDSEVDPKLVAGLYVGISSAYVQLPEGNAFPLWGRSVTRLELWS
ncbi:tyrosinase precursor [Drechmeria coniospora]|uniref:Tyrosinase n=1 Tax=Drechmeria coniospora TaxID=98403 RepID=A0A151GLX2_DRECN|nr:tyrosinase precursor [Drechmeria coniospora]KYK58078.1 tyrosinase precursor [Drechmeria coniospora]